MKLSVFEERKVVINGLTLHYLEWEPSKRPTLLLLHGYLSRAQIWTGFASELSRNFRILALNQRGHGNSDWSPDGAYSIDDHFTDLARFIDLLDLNELILMGHSMGATIAVPVLAIEPRYQAAILSGAGGSYIENIVHKQSPVEVRPLAELTYQFGADETGSARDHDM